MADNFRPLQAQNFSLAGAGCVIGATSIVLKSFETIDGTPITMSMLGDIAYMTLEPGNGTFEEQISFAGVTQNANGTATLTTVKSVLFEYPYTQTAGVSKTHAGSTTAVLSNTSGFYNELVSKDNDETITGTWTFTSPNYPRMDTAATPPTDDEEFATKKYVDDIVVSGAPDASATVKGITKLSTAPVSPTDPIAVGTNDTRVPTQDENNALVGNNTDIAVGTGNKYVTQTGFQKAAEIFASSAAGSDTYAITLSPVPTSYVNGMAVRFKADVANTGAATLNVNSLGAVSITKNNSDALITGDIEANQIVDVVYNSTGPVFQMVGQTALSGSADIQEFASSGTWTKPAGAKKVYVQAWAGGGSGSKSNAGGNAVGGGGGGQYIDVWMNASDLAGTVTVTVGDGGTSISANNTNGNSGGNTTFGSHLTATGGNGGITGTPANDGTGGDGGSGVIPAVNGLFGIGGAEAIGGAGLYSAGGGGGTAASTGRDGGFSVYGGAGGGGSGATNGNGGESSFGGDGGAGSNTTNAVAGSVPGGGGGGNVSAGNSGAGGKGQMRVTTFF